MNGLLSSKDFISMANSTIQNSGNLKNQMTLSKLLLSLAKICLRSKEAFILRHRLFFDSIKNPV